MLINDELVDRQEVIERDADYITKPSWDDPSNIKYFDFECNEISREKAKSLRKGLIGESSQYDLLIRVKDESELRKLVDLFKEYTSKHILNKNGSRIKMGKDYEINKCAINDAWEIPLLICTSRNNKKPKNLYDFLMVNQFNISERLGDVSIILSTLVKTKKIELNKVLIKGGSNVQVDKKYALRVSIEDYLEKQ